MRFNLIILVSTAIMIKFYSFGRNSDLEKKITATNIFAGIGKINQNMQPNNSQNSNKVQPRQDDRLKKLGSFAKNMSDFDSTKTASSTGKTNKEISKISIVHGPNKLTATKKYINVDDKEPKNNQSQNNKQKIGNVKPQIGSIKPLNNKSKFEDTQLNKFRNVVGNGINDVTKNIVVPNDAQKKIDDELNSEDFIISWEIKPAKKQLEKYQKLDKYIILEDIIRRANAWIQKYIRIRKGEVPLINPTPGQFCDYQIDPSITYKSHMVMIVDVATNESFNQKDNEDINSKENDVDNEILILASGGSCDKTETKPSTVGNLTINLDVFFENLTPTEIMRRVITVIHETLHAIAFYIEDQESLFRNKKPITKHTTLMEIFEFTTNAFKYGHWVDSIILNDFMITTDRLGTLFSIFTAEFLEHVNNKLVGVRKNLPNNYLWDHIKDHKAFFTYQCDEEEENPPFNLYCGKTEAENNIDGCSKDFQYKTVCDDVDPDTMCRPRIIADDGNCFQENENNTFESFGTQSRCFELYKDNERSGASCLKYQYKTTDEGTFLFVGHDSVAVPCKTDDEIVNITVKKEGKRKVEIFVKCPKLDYFKNVVKNTTCPNNCHNNGICVNGKCVCVGGFDETTDCKAVKSVNQEKFLLTETLDPIAK